MVDLVVTAEEVAGRLQLRVPLEAKVKALLEESIADAQADVEGYLRLPVTPQTVVQKHVRPRWDWWTMQQDGWEIDDPYLIDIISTVPEVDDVYGQPTGRFTVTYTSGLDVANDPKLAAIKRFIKAAAQADPDVVRMWQEVTGIRGPVMNASTDGQSVTYQPITRGAASAGTSNYRQRSMGTEPGMLPHLQSLDAWRSRTAYQRRDHIVVEGAYPWWW